MRLSKDKEFGCLGCAWRPWEGLDGPIGSPALPPTPSDGLREVIAAYRQQNKK